ncbi:MAG TPA: acyclic terpene utilization AtuA family protein, partial [Myxococcota bacterium]
MSEPLRIANCSGFYGDRLSAAREMVEGGPIDVLTGDYLAELTLAILLKDRLRDPGLGYAKTFLHQLRAVASACLARGIKIVVNAGGLNPAGLAEASRALYAELGLRAVVAHIEGDDVRPLLEKLQAAGEPLTHLDKGTPLAALDATVLSANAYLGGLGIARALERGADLVVCPRVTDASLVVGPAVWRFGWAHDDWDRLACAVVAGHII